MAALLFICLSGLTTFISYDENGLLLCFLGGLYILKTSYEINRVINKLLFGIEFALC